MKDYDETHITVVEATELMRLESIIEKGRQTFIEVGAALMEIKDSGLYKQYGTFEHYCKERWGYARQTAYRLIDSAKVNQNLSPIGDKPKTESQSRPLSGLPPTQQQEAWKKAVDTAPEGKVTAKHVEKTVQKFQRVSVPKEKPPEYGIRYAQMAIMDLEKIADDDVHYDEALDSVEQWIGKAKGDEEKAVRSADIVTRGGEEEKDSDELSQLKRWYKKAKKKDREVFKSWVRFFEDRLQTLKINREIAREDKIESKSKGGKP